VVRPVPLARRRLLLALAGALLLPAAGSRGARTIRITAEKFKFTPQEVRLKRGETVELELVSLDRLHGFSAPDFGVRADVIPGREVKLEITPTRAGEFTFVCDNFCGDDHDEMSGKFVVD
jgi:cytochrome c oxidase subunit II